MTGVAPSNDNNMVKKHQLLISTVEENKLGFTKQEQEQAKVARGLYHNIGALTVEIFKNLVQMNGIKNCPVTVANIKNSEKIYGLAISRLKGVSVRRNPKPVKRDIGIF